MRRKLASISVDLDEVPRYAAIHGVEVPTGPGARAVYEKCVPRITAWFDDDSIRATFFAIGEDLEREENRRAIAGLHAAGHEIGNHSYHHHYDLTRRAAGDIGDEIRRGATIIEQSCGTRPVGFRAPGYTVSDVLFSALEACGVEYDSSVFPCPSYYAVKAAALGAIKLRGRQSSSILDRPEVLRAPREPYRIGRPFWRSGDGLMELPIGVTPLQLPYIGTSLVLGGDQLSDRLSRQMLRREFINLELHGFDLADSYEDGLEALRPHRADLRRPAAEKLRSLRTAVRVIRDAGYELVTLEEAARHFKAKSNP
ncbi:MAG: polysaccharide deacetylase family protein [Deltaproteobacteria bacterium]|nr:polysaccharide deacetylase family protein [Deltaproteobacteria bacterium]MBT8464198.1 polysaccharide deacetylase family protein [Deltaproteobacteria bacterium]NND29562.1 polysaccharide deacetylase family protein [Myxococcales bacterium]NNK06058.1 polysaccharide deacetylase family protein [Myxococcales bacterium]NNK44537.1 polysaccharide deacetylase family protein [Myxococcales bacterium]